MPVGTLNVGINASGDGECAGFITPKTQFDYAPTVYFDVKYEAYQCDAIPGGDCVIYWDDLGTWKELMRSASGSGWGYVFWKDFWIQSANGGHFKAEYAGQVVEFWIGANPVTQTPTPTPAPTPVLCADTMWTLIHGPYYDSYVLYKGGGPDYGDAEWLCANGIDTEQELQALLASAIPTPTPTPTPTPPPPTELFDVDITGSPAGAQIKVDGVIRT